MNSPAEPRRFGLSKSRIAAFEQCAKRLWLQTHRPDLAEIDADAAAGFAAGHAVGAIACSLHPGGVMVEAEPDLGAALRETQRLIAKGHPGPIFEATFAHDGVLVRVDILERASDGRWALREVKSSTGAKAHHDGDLATQVWVLEQAGVSLAAASIRHVDRSFVLRADGDYTGLFADAEQLDAVRGLVAGRATVVATARAMLARDVPRIDPGPQCTSPYTCEFIGHCDRDRPAGPQWPVSILPHGAGRRFAAAGIMDLLALDEAALGEREARIVAATRTGTPFHDAGSARLAMAGWTYPRAWLDFETIGFAAPRWRGTRPYQQVPFQFSLHLEAADGAVTHHDFLALDGGDPRAACAAALVDAIPAAATPVAYNAAFERRVLRDLADAVPSHAERLRAMADRLVDLLPVARACWYHRDQRGSWSIKAVLPTLADLDYATLDVRDGSAAQAAYLEAIDPATSSDRRAALDAALRAYCRLDTWAMLVLAKRLAGEDA